MVPALHIGGTRQHIGKTLIAMGMVGVLRQRGMDARYMKPLGQRETNLAGERVDDDAALLSRVYGWSLPPKAMSPVTMPAGFTERAITGKVSSEQLAQRIREAYTTVAQGADLVVVEGTGHAAVGSVVGLGNAQVAKLLGATVVVVTGGGIGQPIDDFTLNATLYRGLGVPIAGTICNKVRPEKASKVIPLLRRWFEEQGVRFLGYIPFDRTLTHIALLEVVAGLGADVLCGEDLLRMRVCECVVGAAPAHRMLEHPQAGVLAIIPADRPDVVMAAVRASQATQRHAPAGVAICLTGDLTPHESILELVRDAGMPVIVSHLSTFRTAAQIDDLVAKTMPTDAEKIRLASRLVEECIDIEAVLSEVLGTTAAAARAPRGSGA